MTDEACEGRRGFRQRLSHYRKPDGEPTEFVLCSKMGYLTRIVADGPSCSRCGAKTHVAPKNVARVEAGEPVVCSDCHFYPGAKKGWE